MTSGFDVNLAPRAPTDHSRNGLMTLLGLFRELGVYPDLDTLLRRVETTALQVFDCERLTVFVNEPRANALCSRVATGSHEIHTPVDRGIVGATFSERHIINVDDAPADPRFYDAIDRQTGFRTRSLLSVPLQGIDQHAIGVLELLNKRDGRFTATDEALAVTLGSLTEIALERQTLFDQYRAKQRLEHDLQLAREIQQSLLPVPIPLVPGFDIVGWTQPLDATGGDFYDCFDLPDGRIGLVVADVTGHGLAASLLACETRALIRAAAASTASIAEIATRANAQLHRDLHHERFAVVFLAALEAATNRLEFVGAGCAPILYRQAERCFVPTEATVPPLGVLPVLEGRIVTELTLRGGDTVAMLTDGLYEWENDTGQPFGLERLGERVRHRADDPAAPLIRGVYEDVLAHAGRVPQLDDLTALVIKRLP